MKIGLYIHIPFCVSKCYYCDFLSFARPEMQEAYTSALINEIKNYAALLGKHYTVQSLFIGGGTPTVLPPVLLDKICMALIQHFQIAPDAEWTIEANPGTVTNDHVRIINTYPISRISLGLQSTHNSLLKSIGRCHTFEDWHRSYSLIKTNTSCDLNADIMFALPSQTYEAFQDTLKILTTYPLEHLSLYSLIIEEGTKFGRLYDVGELIGCDEHQDRQMYHHAKAYLKDKGYQQYEISNWAKTGKACRHNILYWKREPYIGLGLGAHSFFEDTRYHNEEQIEKYIQADGCLKVLQIDHEIITKAMAMQEFMFLGLRMTQGISIDAFSRQFGVDLFDIYENPLNKWIKHHVLVKNNDSLRLSDYGMDVCNEVFSSFL